MGNMFRNHEGYTDKTAGAAITALVREERKKMALKEKGMDETNMLEICRGDIWITDGGNGEATETLVLGAHGKYCTTLLLRPTAPEENAVEVISRTRMYTDAGKPGYVFYNRFREFVKSVPDKEIARIEKGILHALGIESAVMDGWTAKAKEAEPVAAQENTSEKVVEEPEKPQCNCRRRELGHELQVAKLTAERDMMKNLYEDAVSRLMVQQEGTI